MTPLPASPGQAGLFVEEHVAPLAYNWPMALHITGRCSTAAVVAACRAIAAGQPALRARFSISGEHVVQHLDAAPDVEAVSGEVGAVLAEMAADPFDLQAGPPIRFRVVTGASGRPGAVAVCAHHIALDGASQVLVTELLASALGGEAVPTVPDSRYAAALAAGARLAEEVRDGGDAYWAARCEAGLAPPGLPPVPPGAPGRFDAVAALDAAGSAAVLEGARRLGSTPLQLALLAMQAWYRGRGVAGPAATALTAGVRPPGADGVAGYFVNLVPVVVDLPAGASVAAACGEVRGQLREVLEYRHHPYRRVVAGYLASEASPDRRLDEVILTFRRYPARLPAGDGTQLEPDFLHTSARPKTRLLVRVAEASNRLAIHVECDPAWGGGNEAARVAAELRATLLEAVRRPDRAWAELAGAGASADGGRGEPHGQPQL